MRGLIEDMIAKLTKEAAEEADQKSFCDEETSESKSKQATLTGKLDKTSARIEKAVADKVHTFLASSKIPLHGFFDLPVDLQTFDCLSSFVCVFESLLLNGLRV